MQADAALISCYTDTWRPVILTVLIVGSCHALALAADLLLAANPLDSNDFTLNPVVVVRG